MADANLPLTLAGVPLGVLDLAPVPDGSTAGDALRATIDLAKKTEDLGFTRFWVAEHHGMPGIASSSPPVLIGHIADRHRDLAGIVEYEKWAGDLGLLFAMSSSFGLIYARDVREFRLTQRAPPAIHHACAAAFVLASRVLIAS